VSDRPPLDLPRKRGSPVATTLDEFLSALGSDRPVPAGGSAAAAAVAMAAGLVEKSARLSTSHWIGAAGVGKRAAVLRRLAAILVEADARSYADYVKAVRAARGLHTVERRRMLEPAQERIVEVPLTIVRAAAETVDLAAEIAEHGNPNLRSDAIVAVHLAAAAAQAGTTTLAANVGRAGKDERLAEARRLARAASAVSRRLSSPVPAGGRGRARERSRGNGGL
jgi:methenyltetrahydrofolate cyclohydrolase